MADTIESLAARLAALEAEVADVPHVQARRAERARVRRERELDQILAISDASERTRALQALAQSDRRAAFARCDLPTLRRAVLDAPTLLADVPPHMRDAIEVHLVQLPARVRVTEDPAAPRTTRSAFEISEEQAEHLVRVGLRHMIDIRAGYLACEPLDTRSRTTVLDREQYLALIQIDPYLAAQIDRGHLHAEDLDDDANRTHQLEIWATVPRHMRTELPSLGP
jgi:hypothetical protein